MGATQPRALRPGVGMFEFAHQSFKLPQDWVPNRYSVVIHGVGLCDEYPKAVYREDLAHGEGYECMLAENMVVSVESYYGCCWRSRGRKTGGAGANHPRGARHVVVLSV